MSLLRGSKRPIFIAGGNSSEKKVLTDGTLKPLQVFNTCLRILKEKGYAIRMNRELEPDEKQTKRSYFWMAEGCAIQMGQEPESDGMYAGRCFWIAEKDGFYFSANNPIELLGLVAIRDHFQPSEDRSYWWRADGPDLWMEFEEKACGQPAASSTPQNIQDPGCNKP